jgi:hypothetical protein
MANVCDLSRIYNEEYQYSFPKFVLEGYLEGRGFDNKTPYTEVEQQNLKEDINDIYHYVTDSAVKKPIAVITAGAPASGKTTLLHQILDEKAANGKKYAYVCPDDVCLKRMFNTYQSELANGSQKDMYRKWREGSNAANQIILGNLIFEKYAFYQGSTSTSPLTWKSFQHLKSQGYQIKLLHVTATDEMRAASLAQRDQVFVQCTDEDFVQKGKMLPERINDTFLRYADKIKFYYRPSADADAELAAIWRNNEGQKTLEIVDTSHYQRIKTLHDASVGADLSWEATVEASLTPQ